ncbi:hypothetical protein QAD02_001881 [Eretmocerus hayati]|uniref:Uncharacterized protein n=1 Tax=Eretmocerus hayati TaxID=131215 RepID=A0ACC2NHP3_9HYME|nr:hypothetical protein QAD02_001881 [Eretmocerus hayati]
MSVKKPVNLIDAITDEIALEGLDGITLEALWLRISVRLGQPLPLKDGFMQQIWNIVLQLDDVWEYELETPRKNLVIFDHFELEYLKIESEKDVDYNDIYIHFPIEDEKTGNRGSCSTYYTRKNVTDEVKHLTVAEALQRYGQKLVIVASQILREQALYSNSVNPNLHLPLTHYCVLERVGRARKIGEITLKKIKNFKEDAKTLFYVRKCLQTYGLIKKQIYYQGNTGKHYNGQNTGTLVHLTRFFHARKPKVIVWAEHLIDYLKSKENYAAEYNEVKNELNIEYGIKKFFKIQMLQKVFRTDVKVPYRSYYPTSADKEWAVKSNPTKERIIKLVTLSDPNIEISDIWRSEEVEEVEEQVQMNIAAQKFNVPYLKQAYDYFESKESGGATQTELKTDLGLTRLTSRTFVRNLVKANVVSIYLDDVGRQRLTKFVSHKFESKSSLRKQFEEEMSKIKEHKRSIQVEKEKFPQIEKNVVDDNSQDCLTPEKTKLEHHDELFLSDETVSLIRAENDQKFARVNSLLKKYKLYQSVSKYSYTSSKNRSSVLKSLTLKSDLATNLKMNEVEITGKTPDGTAVSQEHNLKNENLEDGGLITNRSNKNGHTDVLGSDFYKAIETKLIVEKPECKKKSNRVAVVGLMQELNDDKSQKPNLSYRLLRRANLIIDSVRKHKIIEDFHKLMKFIHAEEDKEGLDFKIDKHSLIRLLQKLMEDNLIKNITLIISHKNDSKQKVVNLICDPSINVDDPAVQSVVEQIKLKFCMMEAPALRQGDKPTLAKKTRFYNEPKLVVGKINYRKDNRIGKKHGYTPKFIRMKTMHLFLFYLIYDHPKKEIPKDNFLRNLEQQGYSDIDIDDHVSIYSTEIGWKMFVPPLPEHRGYPNGWAMMCDILMRMPLSLFVKVHNVNWEVPGLIELLEHPIHQHTLVRSVPVAIRNLLFVRRKYLFSIHEIVTRLCYMGLVQFGPQMLKEKDQVFIYLNRRAELLDTTSSAAGYHKIEDKPYPVTKYEFTSLSVVENYWYELWNTCINTCLGGRSIVEGKDILLEDLARKVEMIQALRVRQPEEAIECDTGFMPGDRKGAAGIDSAFFPHLKRNWSWMSVPTKQTTKKENRPLQQNSQTAKSSKIGPKKGPQRKRSNLLRQNQSKASGKSGNSKDATRSNVRAKDEKGYVNIDFPLAQASKPPKVVRKVMPRKPMRKRDKLDEIDFSALQRMEKLRVDWEAHEDNILLVCKVATVYLCPNPRRNQISFITIRDVLRSYSFTSHNKTSRACQRRLLYMLKQPKTVNSVLLGVEEVKQDYLIKKRFGSQVDSVRGETEDPADFDKKIAKTFKELVAYIAKKYYNISSMNQREPVVLPKTIQEFNLFYKLKLPTKTMKSPGISKEIREINDIHTATINSVIHSSMCCGKERRSWAYQLFKVYQQYPEYLLRSAMMKIRADQMVIMKKNYMCAHKKFGNCMPMSSSQYQLSSSYYYKFQTKWPYEVFSQCYGILYSLFEHYSRQGVGEVESKANCSGTVALIHDLLSTDILKIDIEIPDQIIMLDPGTPEKDEVYKRIADRYKAILKSLSYENSEQYAHFMSKVSEFDEESHIDSVENMIVSEEQSDFVKVRSMKRPGENIEVQSEAKKQKIDDVHCHNGKSIESSTCVANKSLDVDSQASQNTVPIKTTDDITISGQCSGEGMDVDCNEVAIYESQFKKCRNKITVDNEQLGVLETSGIQSDLRNSQTTCTIADQSIPLKVFDHGQSSSNATESMTVIHSSNIVSPPPKTSKLGTVRVNELLERSVSDFAPDDDEKPSEIHDAVTRYTRIAMLKMREELHGLTLFDCHHAHEFFVVNAFKMFQSFNVNKDDCLTKYRGMELPEKLLPIDVESINNVLDDVKKHAVFPRNTLSPDELKNETQQAGLFNWEDVNNVWKFIKSKAEFGATLYEIVNYFDNLQDHLAGMLSFLCGKRVVLRAGIVTVRYIHHRYVNPWIIHSYKILRLDKESHPTVPGGSVYVFDDDDKEDRENKRVTTAANLFYKSPNESATNDCVESTTDLQKESEEKMIEHDAVTLNHVDDEKQNDHVSDSNEKSREEDDGTEESAPPDQKRLRRNRTVLLKQKDIYRAAKLLDFNTAEEIRVVIKPWIRIDGVLNRRVLDRMLGAVLCYCMEKPGLPLTVVQKRFSPALQPYHTRELLEILVKLKCVEMKVQKMPKVTLFSRPAQIHLDGNSDLIADSNAIIIEVSVQASLKFGMFLSNRSYNLDFLSTL